MLITCSRLQAAFPAEGIRLDPGAAPQSIWDEHGGTYVIRLEGLEVVEVPVTPGESAISWEIELPLAAALMAQIKEFAAQQSLPLVPTAASSLGLSPTLCACHLPGRSLFIFCEAPQLLVRRVAPRALELAITGTFRARRVPSREIDAVIHLLPGAMAQLLSFILGQAEQ